jgi:hypothetical protein
VSAKLGAVSAVASGAKPAVAEVVDRSISYPAAPAVGDQLRSISLAETTVAVRPTTWPGAASGVVAVATADGVPLPPWSTAVTW